MFWSATIAFLKNLIYPFLLEMDMCPSLWAQFTNGCDPILKWHKGFQAVGQSKSKSLPQASPVRMSGCFSWRHWKREKSSVWCYIHRAVAFQLKATASVAFSRWWMNKLNPKWYLKLFAIGSSPSCRSLKVSWSYQHTSAGLWIENGETTVFCSLIERHATESPWKCHEVFYVWGICYQW